jgi:poly-gamma-glutamate capsule biosynthesis protein CapA/YwtB (metallophosphatase superfamily)
MRILRICCLLAFFPTTATVAGQETDSTLTILFTGDIMGHDMQIASAYNDSTGTWSYDSVFKYVSPVISAADIAVGNLEVTLGGTPFKGYPAFSSPDALAAACMNAGFDILSTANNHAADRGSGGIIRTLRVLDSLQIRHTGTWADSTARDTLSPLVVMEKGITIALLSYTYGTNGIVVAPPALVSYIDTLRIGSDISMAKKHGADPVVIFVHWGTEYDTLPDRQQIMTADAMLRSGADMIIGSHPHVLQPMIMKEDSTGRSRPVVWSMGNLVSNQRLLRRDGGAMIVIEITRKEGRTCITDAGYILTWVYTPVEHGKRMFYILPCSQYENAPGFFSSSSDFDSMTLFLKIARRLLQSQNAGFSELVYSDGMWIKRSM